MSSSTNRTVDRDEHLRAANVMEDTALQAKLGKSKFWRYNRNVRRAARVER